MSVRNPSQRRPKARRQVQNNGKPSVTSVKTEQRTGCGCLILLFIILAILYAVFHHGNNGGSGGNAAQALLSQISGCGNISATGGNSLDDNTVAEGSCDLTDGTAVQVYVWAAGDDLDEHDYVYWQSGCGSSSSPATDGCFTSSDPAHPWFIDVTGKSVSDWTPVESAFGVLSVTSVPDSWCSRNCPLPGGHTGSGGIHVGDGDHHHFHFHL